MPQDRPIRTTRGAAARVPAGTCSPLTANTGHIAILPNFQPENWTCPPGPAPTLSPAAAERPEPRFLG
jgi:hypothetical protein